MAINNGDSYLLFLLKIGVAFGYASTWNSSGMRGKPSEQELHFEGDRQSGYTQIKRKDTIINQLNISKKRK